MNDRKTAQQKLKKNLMGCLGVFSTANFVGLRNLKLITALDLDLYPGSLCIKFSFFTKRKSIVDGLQPWNWSFGFIDGTCTDLDKAITYYL